MIKEEKNLIFRTMREVRSKEFRSNPQNDTNTAATDQLQNLINSSSLNPQGSGLVLDLIRVTNNKAKLTLAR
jgi:hypothetical protein